ncbi:MAG: threonine synthase [Halorubrum sp. J07HR59]|nr:MAG: threonine synthase [Halorubrum sp. J07HR59]
MTVARLECSACGSQFSDRWRCTCGAPLDFAEQRLPASPPSSVSNPPNNGLWAFDAFLPVGDDPADRVTLGEGMTPLVDPDPNPDSDLDSDPDPDPDTNPGTDANPRSRRLDRTDRWHASFKLEYVSPTGSFKDRGATTVLTRARELGVTQLVEDSSGNAGAAVATYAARAGIDARVFVPAAVKAGKLSGIRAAGADPVRVPGDRAAVTQACVDAVREGDSWYASHAWNPAFFAGTATFAYEVAFQRGWTAPDAVVLPIGHGTLFLGAFRGFRVLKAAGWIDNVPRLLGAQAAGVAPIVEELHGPQAANPAREPNETADGIQIADPVRKNQILDAIDETDGDVIAISEADTTRELERLHRAGFYTEPTCAVPPAALRKYYDRGVLDRDADVVVPLTGSGLKN